MKSITIAGLMAVAAFSNAQVFTQWNFNSATNDATTSTGTTATAIGVGSASLIGGATSTGFNAGGTTSIAPASSSDTNVTDNSGWQTTTYPAISAVADSGKRGVQFNVSTAQGAMGYRNIVVSFDVRRSNTSSRFLQFQYTTDGTNFSSAGLIDNGVIVGLTGDSWVNGNTFNLSSVAGVENNANFGFRIVSIVSPTTGAYVAASNTSTYAGGTLRYDMVTVSGEPVPEPASLVALGLGASALLRRRARKA